MIYYKDSFQINEINKLTNKMFKDLTKTSEYDKLLIEYKKEVNYWTSEYPSQITQWEEDGGFIIGKN